MPSANRERLDLSAFLHNDDPVAVTRDVKQFLTRFGYSPRMFDPLEVLDTQTIKAINKYQRFYRLTVTREISREFLNHISRPRCARSDYLLSKGSEEDGVPPSCFMPSQRTWKRCKVRYFLNNPPGGFQRDAILGILQTAFDRWVGDGKLKFSFVLATEEPYDILIDWIDPNNSRNVNLSVLGCFGYGDPPPEEGGLRTDTISRLLFPADQQWTDTGEKGKFDIFTVALHEIGHVIGLEHCSGKNIMNPGIIDVMGVLSPQMDELGFLKNLYRDVVCQS